MGEKKLGDITLTCRIAVTKVPLGFSWGGKQRWGHYTDMPHRHDKRSSEIFMGREAAQGTRNNTTRKRSKPEEH